ncbi:PepSY domain-containing protein [Xanthomonas hortorum pv. vitians]|nr:PepSY-associated TM helix domain-containing protein [Xanthomonas hortorum]MCE4285015.1 PepSY domain-containing protein [Xanthomonas hortorum pv. vitians]MCE4293392.1 PepSY domain-containing protein [Xanthomonas hortorum pv. vitians]MCE4310566.1 PepSY domain-containing protein [Xanthomonas hortorum pv. vitians]
MAWLHTWCGLTCGWLLCAIFLTGTLSVFRDPITRWMQAAPALPSASTHAALPEQALVPRALAQLRQLAPQARLWRITLPAHPGEALTLFWRTPDGQGQASLDPGSGEVLPSPWGRQTEGGRHFMSFHYTLHGGIPGYWLVGWVSMCGLIALVSGVIVHKRIFLDFFTFRPGKGQRSWLDAHNATAVLTLPFLLMIVYTGLAYFYTSYMPAPLQAVYGSDEDAYTRYADDLSPASPVTGADATALNSVPAYLPELVQRAAVLNGVPAQTLVIERPDQPGSKLRVIAPVADTGSSRRLLNPANGVVFDANSGAVLEQHADASRTDVRAQDVEEVIKTLHVAGFGGWTSKWLYFICGLAGTLMMATGTLLFSIKRRRRSEQEFGAATAGIYRVVEALNVAALAGTALASIAYFYANRLVPAAQAERVQIEIHAFLWVWMATLLHALLRPPVRAWVEQLAMTALLCLGLPLLNALTTGQHVGVYLAAGDLQRAGVELVSLAFAVAFAYGSYRAHRSAMRPAPVRAKRDATAAMDAL